MTDFLDDYDDELQDSFFPKKKREELEIPDFLSKGKDEPLPTEEQLMAQAVLNNTPNNSDIEKQNHLSELDRACQNWDFDEWKIVIQRASSTMMSDELKRRLEVMEEYVSNQRNNMNVLTGQKI